MKKYIITGAMCGGIGLIIGGKVATKKIVKLLDSDELKEKMAKAFTEELMKDYKEPIYKMEDLIFDSLNDAEEVSDNLNNTISRYGYASVHDLYDLAGVVGKFRDNKYGWTGPVDSKIDSHKNGYILKIDEPKILK